jgi:hypothetical protein
VSSLCHARSFGQRQDSPFSRARRAKRLTRIAQDRRNGARRYLRYPPPTPRAASLNSSPTIVATLRQRPLPSLPRGACGGCRSCGRANGTRAHKLLGCRPKAAGIHKPPQAAPHHIHTENEKEEPSFIDSAADALRAKPVDGSSKLNRGLPPTGFRRRNAIPDRLNGRAETSYRRFAPTGRSRSPETVITFPGTSDHDQRNTHISRVLPIGLTPNGTTACRS